MPSIVARSALPLSLVLALAAAQGAPAAAQDASDGFYKGKTVTLVVAFGAGGGYGLYSRVLSKHMARHIPGNPTIQLQFMSGAAGRKAANYVYTVSPRDGSVMSLLSNAAAHDQVLEGGVRYDAAKFAYVGRMVSMNSIAAVWHTAPATSLEKAKTTEIIFGAPGKGDQAEMNPELMRALLGYKFKIVNGYPGSNAIYKAMEQGEVHGQFASWSSLKSTRGQWLTEKKVALLAEVGLESTPDLKAQGVPLVIDLAKNPADRAVLEFMASSTTIGRSFSVPPGVPAARVTLLRRAFDATMTDSQLIAEAKKLNMDLEPMRGESIQPIVEKVVAATPDVVQRTRAALGRK